MDIATIIGILIVNFTKLLAKEPTLFWFNVMSVVFSAILFLLYLTEYPDRESLSHK
jgi:hypothetical protein